MDSLPTSEDGSEGNEYNSLEDRILNTKRDHDEETRIAYRPEPWNMTLMQEISIQLNTNKSEVCNRAFDEGLKVVRDDVGWVNLKEVFDMNRYLLSILNSSGIDMDVLSDSRESILSASIDVEDNPEGRLVEPINVPVKRSVISEIDENFCDRLNLSRSEVIRVVVSSGLNESQFAGRTSKEYVSKMLKSFNDTIGKNKELFNREFLKLLTYSYGMSEDYSDDLIRKFKAFYDSMDGDKKDKAGFIIQRMEDEQS